MPTDILNKLREAFPEINWQTKLDSNVIRGFYDQNSNRYPHIMITFFRSSKVYKCSFRSFKVICESNSTDVVEAIKGLGELLNDKEEEIRKAVEAINKKGDD